MKKNKVQRTGNKARRSLFIVLCSLLPLSLAAQSVYVEDFTAAQEDLRPLMPGATDVVRSALMQNTIAEFTESRAAAAYIISGAVTRFGAVKPPDAKSGGSFSGSANVSIQLFNFLSPALQTGHIGSQNNSGGRTRQQQEEEPHVTVSARLVEVRTGRIVTSSTISAVNWEDYLAKAAALACELSRSLPFPQTAFSGVWTAVVEHDGREDAYRLNFRSGGQCGVTVTSTDAWGNAATQTADGRYRWTDEILTINVRFQNPALAYLSKIEWRAAARLASDRNSFNMTIPVSAQTGALRVGAQFWKE